MWPSGICVAPPYGLYLSQVHYDNKDKEFPVDHPLYVNDPNNSTENEFS